MRRLTAYVAGSVTLATGVVTYAALERPNFYSAAVYLSQSNACLMILCNLALVAAGSLLYGLQQLLFGTLRPLETEQLWERGWFAMMEWVFAMSTFRDEFGVWFLIMFASLFAGKIWGWLAEGRVEQLEQQAPNDARLFHGRLIASLMIYVLFAFQMFNYSFDIVLVEARPGMTIMFVFEFAILCIAALSTCIRYGIWAQEHRIIKQQVTQAIDARKAEIRRIRQEAEQRHKDNPEASNGNPYAGLPSEEDVDENEIEAPGWEAKRSWLFALDIVSDFLKLAAYMAFFTILTVFYGIPIYIIRDLYMTMRSFTKRVTDYLRFQAATRDMDTRYPNATGQDLAADNTCIVCREEMRPYEAPAAGAVPDIGQAMQQKQRPKKLPCGHILHFGCLSSWLERQQACPICRRSVFAAGEAPNGRPAAPAVPGQPQAQDAPGQQPEHQPRRRRREGRVYRLGPIRVQFGGRVRQHNDQDLLNELGRLARNRAQDRQNAPVEGNAIGEHADQGPLTGAAVAAVDGEAEATGTEIHPGIRSAAARMALNNIQQQIQSEIEALNLQGQRAHNIRALLNELDRARGVPQAPPRPQPRTGFMPFGLMQMPAGFPPVQMVPAGFAQQFTRPENVDFSQPTIPLGHTSTHPSPLPPGVVIPPGWTLTPIVPVHNTNHFPPPPPPPATMPVPAPPPSHAAPRMPGATNATGLNPLQQFLANNAPYVPNHQPTAGSSQSRRPHDGTDSRPQNSSTLENGAGSPSTDPVASRSSELAPAGAVTSARSSTTPPPRAQQAEGTAPTAPLPSWSFGTPPLASNESENDVGSIARSSVEKGKAPVRDLDMSQVGTGSSRQASVEDAEDDEQGL